MCARKTRFPRNLEEERKIGWTGAVLLALAAFAAMFPF